MYFSLPSLIGQFSNEKVKKLRLLHSSHWFETEFVILPTLLCSGHLWRWVLYLLERHACWFPFARFYLLFVVFWSIWSLISVGGQGKATALCPSSLILKREWVRVCVCLCVSCLIQLYAGMWVGIHKEKTENLPLTKTQLTPSVSSVRVQIRKSFMCRVNHECGAGPLLIRCGQGKFSPTALDLICAPFLCDFGKWKGKWPCWHTDAYWVAVTTDPCDVSAQWLPIPALIGVID